MESNCRLCLQKLNKNTSFDIFPDKLAGSQENVIPIRLAAVAAIEVSKCDGLPQRICQSCRYQLELSYAFRKKSQISDGKLRRHLKLLSQGKTVKNAPLFEDDEDQDQEMCEDSLEFLRTCDRQRDEELRQQIRNEVEAENRELYESIKIELRKEMESELRSEIEKQVKIDFEKRIFPEKLKKVRMEESKAILNDLEEFLRMKIFERNDVDDIAPVVAAKLELTNNLNEEADKEDKEIKTKSRRTENLLNKNAHKQIVNDQLINRPIDQKTEKISCTNVMTYQIRMKSNMELNTNVETAAGDNLDNVAVISSNEIDDDVDDDEMSQDQDDNLEILKVFDYESGEDSENTKESEKCEKTEDDVQIIEADSISKSPVLSFYCEDPSTDKSSVGRSTATPKIFKCTMCPIQVSTQYSLERHLRVHLKGGNKIVTCPECKIVFSCSSTLKRHMVIHSGKRPYVCAECNKSFPQREILKRHYNTQHQGVRHHECPHCDRKFSQKFNLSEHIEQNHSNEPRKRYNCALCSKSFLFASGLSRHLSSHSGRTFQCFECDRSFTDRSSIKRHVWKVHGIEKSQQIMAICKD